MGAQASLFEYGSDRPTPQATRRVEPTSAAAYREIQAEGIVNAAQQEVLALLKAHGPMTGTEVDAASGSASSHKRLAELERLGRVRVECVRPCNISGRSAKACTLR